jgi:hypothetical protein
VGFVVGVTDAAHHENEDHAKADQRAPAHHAAPPGPHLLGAPAAASANLLPEGRQTRLVGRGGSSAAGDADLGVRATACVRAATGVAPGGARQPGAADRARLGFDLFAELA